MKSIPALASFSFCLCLCLGPPTPASAAEEDVYNPLEVGLTWTADVTATLPAGKTFQGKATREITGTKEIDGKTYFISVTSIHGIPGFGTMTSYERRLPDGIYCIREADPEKKEYLQSPIPLAVGKTWKVPAEKGKLIFSVDALEAVTVDGTKYENCYKISYKSDSFNFSSYYYAAPRIGNVTEHMKVEAATLVFIHKSLVRNKEAAEAGSAASTPASTTTTTTTK